MMPCESCYTLAYPAYVNSLAIFMTLLILRLNLKSSRLRNKVLLVRKKLQTMGIASWSVQIFSFV